MKVKNLKVGSMVVQGKGLLEVSHIEKLPNNMYRVCYYGIAKASVMHGNTEV